MCCLFNGLILKKKGKLITWNHRKILSLVVYCQKNSKKVCITYLHAHTVCTYTCPMVKNKWNLYTEVFPINWWSIEWTIQFIISYNPNYEMSADSQRYPRLCSKKNLREPSALELWNPGHPTNDLYEKTKIF